MYGIAMLVVWTAILLRRRNSEGELLLCFKDFTVMLQFLIFIVAAIACWSLSISSFWSCSFSINTLIEFINDNWFAIITLFLTGIITVENIMKKPFFHLKSRKAICIMYGIVLTCLVVLFALNFYCF